MQKDMALASEEPTDEYRDIVSKTFASEDDGFQFYNSYVLMNLQTSN
jgi:hypothetical protein